ncbi:unnamed protein product [Ectocarpus sp. 13 AM-2016]
MRDLLRTQKTCATSRRGDGTRCAGQYLRFLPTTMNQNRSLQEAVVCVFFVCARFQKFKSSSVQACPSQPRPSTFPNTPVYIHHYRTWFSLLKRATSCCCRPKLCTEKRPRCLVQTTRRHSSFRFVSARQPQKHNQPLAMHNLGVFVDECWSPHVYISRHSSLPPSLLLSPFPHCAVGVNAPPPLCKKKFFSATDKRTNQSA